LDGSFGVPHKGGPFFVRRLKNPASDISQSPSSNLGLGQRFTLNRSYKNNTLFYPGCSLAVDFTRKVIKNEAEGWSRHHPYS
jgi:hypothetical protein